MANTDNSTPLEISVVINTCDRADPLRTTLYALNRQTYKHFEVVVVLGPTQDNSVEVIDEFAGRVTLVRCPEFNLSISRNMGIEAASGEVIAFIDDDAVPALTWLEQLAAVFADAEIAGTGGKVFMVHPGHGHLQYNFGTVSIFAEHIDIRPGPDAPVASQTPAQYWYPRLMGANMAYRREALIKIGGFDERYAYLFEEPDVAVRLGKAGYKLKPLAEAVVYHAPASSRNREMFTWKINWYAWMRGIIYFTLKNAASEVGYPQALLKAVEHAQTLFKNVETAKSQQAVDPDLYADIRKQLFKGIAWGLWFGLVGPRRIQKSFQPSQRPFLSFLTATSHQSPNIRPLPAMKHAPKKTIMKQEPLRICLLSSHYPPNGTEGIARLTHNLARGLAELGHETHIITRGQSNHVTCYDGAYVHQIRPEVTRYKEYLELGYENLAGQLNYGHAVYEYLQSLLINHRIQIVDSPLWLMEGLVSSLTLDVPMITRLVTSMKILIELEGYGNNPEERLIGDLEKELLKHSSGIVPISQSIKQTCEKVYHLDFSAQSHRVIHAGIKPAPDDEIYWPQKQAKNNPIILFVGRLEKRKGILDLFEAIPQVLKEYPKAEFWLAGSDNSQYDGLAATYHQTYPEYFQSKYGHLANQVKFLGYVPDEKLDSLYQVCDLFVAPSLYESFGLIFLEAMNQARPVIGCEVGGPAEIVANGETGLLVPPQKPPALTEAILTLLNDPAKRAAMGAAGRERLLNHFTYHKMAEGFAEFYSDVLAF